MALRQNFGLVMQYLLVSYIMFFEPLLNAPSEGAFSGVSLPGDVRTAIYVRTILLLISTVAMVVLSLKLGGTRLRDIGLCLPPPERRPEVLRNLVNVIIPVVILSASAALLFPDRIDQALARISGLLPQSPKEQALWVVLALTAGTCEEIIYRGFLVHMLDKLFDGKLKGYLSIVVAAAIFGIRHLYQGWPSVLSLSLFAIIMSEVTRHHQSLAAPMVLHVVVNLRTMFL